MGTQTLFGIFCGVLIATLGTVAASQGIISNALSFVGFGLVALNAAYWLASHLSSFTKWHPQTIWINTKFLRATKGKA